MSRPGDVGEQMREHCATRRATVLEWADGVIFGGDEIGAVPETMARELAAVLVELSAESDMAQESEHNVVLSALRNMGHDVTCGSCVSIAYTGVSTSEHTCERRIATDPLTQQ